MSITSLKVGWDCLGQGIKHARVQHWGFRHYRRLNRERDAAFATYLSHSPRGLHLGAEFYVLKDWFNTDLNPFQPGMYYVDATQPLPFPDGSFDFVFSEHMIEHIPFESGMRLLRECRRILRSSGVIRIATPDLRNVVSLLANHDPDTEAYLRWAVEQFKLPGDPFPKAPVVINNFFRAWGHQFIYDSEMLQRAMERAGFRDIVPQQVGVSAHVPLQNLERHGQTFCDFANRFETMVFEGTTP